MTAGPDKPDSSTPSGPLDPLQKSHFAVLLKLPALPAISLYMILLAGINVVYVVDHRVGALYLLLSVFFITGALGMLLLLRWGWALTVAGVALMSGRFLWGFTTQHAPSLLVQGLLNLVFFLYLVRTDVREKLK